MTVPGSLRSASIEGHRDMKFGIYCAYWEREWDFPLIPYVERCKCLGFDVLEVPCGGFGEKDDRYFRELRAAAEANGMLLSGGYGPRPEHNLASTDETQVENAFAFYAQLFHKMELAGIDRIGGALYSYWPVDFRRGQDKAGDFFRSTARMRRLADLAAQHGVTLCMEALNRFEGYLINQAYECVNYVKAVDRPNVKVMLDTFHMNLEEDSFSDAIRQSGALLGHFHVGEANRRCPGPGSRIRWAEIGRALQETHYDGYVVMEPFVQMGGQVGQDIHLWRDLSNGATLKQLDEDASASLRYLRKVFG